MLRTFWSGWFIYFREGSAAAAAEGGGRERGGGEEGVWKPARSLRVCSETSRQLLGAGTATPHSQKPEKDQSQAGRDKKRHKDRQHAYPRVKVA